MTTGDLIGEEIHYVSSRSFQQRKADIAELSGTLEVHTSGSDLSNVNLEENVDDL